MLNQPSDRRLNPFLFPAETNFRFLMLIAAVLGASLFIYRSLFNALSRAEFGQLVQTCFADQRCWEPYAHKQAWFMAGGVLFVVLVAYVIQRLLPWWKIRSRSLIALTSEDEPEIWHELNTLCQQMKLRYVPQFLVDPGNATIGGVAFGRRGQYYVCLYGGLLLAYYQDRALFQAVVLHELAHLKNADVGKTYFSMAIWYAFLLTAVAPFAISLVVEILRFGASEIALLMQVVWRVGVLGALVYIIRNSVLCIREFYADVRAARHAGMDEALRQALDTLSATSDRWQIFGPLHPLPAQRQRVLADPAPLFQVEVGAALTTGLTVGVAIHNTVFWLMLLLPSEQERTAYVLASLFFASLAIGVVGLGVWRAAFASVRLGNPLGNVGRISLALGLGLALGRPLSLHAAVGALDQVGVWSSTLLSDLCWGAVLLGLVFLFLHWLRLGAIIWLPTATSTTGLRRRYVASLVISAALLAWWLSGILLASEISHTLVTESLTAVPLVGQRFWSRYIVGWPLGILGLMVLVAFPLLGWLIQSGQAVPADIGYDAT